MNADTQILVAAVSSVIGAVVGCVMLVFMWWTRRSDNINAVASRYVALLREKSQTDPMELLLHSGILTLRSRFQVQSAYERIAELGGHDLSSNLPPWMTPDNVGAVIRAARKHGCDISTAGGIFTLLTAEWSPVQIRREQTDSREDVADDIHDAKT